MPLYVVNAVYDGVKTNYRNVSLSLKELEEARRQNRDLHREKFSALSQAKENVEWEKQRQIEQMKEKLERVSFFLKTRSNTD